MATISQHLLPARVLPAKSLIRGSWLKVVPTAQVHMHNLDVWKPGWCPEWRRTWWYMSPPMGTQHRRACLHHQVIQLWYLTKSLLSEQCEPSSRCLISQHFKHFSYPDLSKISQKVSATSPLLCNPSEFCYCFLMSRPYFTWSLPIIFPLVPAGSHEWCCSQTLLWNFSSSVQA